MSYNELERQLCYALRRLALLEGQATANERQEVAAAIRQAIQAMREVIVSGAAIEDAIRYTPTLQQALVAEPWEPFADGMLCGEYQDVIAVWKAFQTWLSAPVPVMVGDVEARQVAPREVIQRRVAAYTPPVEPVEETT